MIFLFAPHHPTSVLHTLWSYCRQNILSDRRNISPKDLEHNYRNTLGVWRDAGTSSNAPEYLYSVSQTGLNLRLRAIQVKNITCVRFWSWLNKLKAGILKLFQHGLWLLPKHAFLPHPEVSGCHVSAPEGDSSTEFDFYVCRGLGRFWYLFFQSGY